MGTTLRVSSKTATTTVVNTVTETDIGKLVLPANSLYAPGVAARFTAAGDILNNSGSAGTVTFKLKLGATTVLTTAATSWAASANRRQWRADILIESVGTDSQRISGHLEISDADTDTWTDHSTDGMIYTGYGTAAVDDAASIDVTLLATMGAAHASFEVTCKQAVLELLR